MRRTKPATIGEILQEFFSRPYVAAKVAEGKLPDFWQEIVGENVAAMTTEFRLVNHILYVTIASSVVRQELFYKRDILVEELNRRAGIRLVNAMIIR